MGHWTYLVFELAWGLPVLVLQWAVGRHRLAAHWRPLGISVVVLTLYLSCADAVAIATGIWSIHSNRIIGLRLGVLPLEEALFFLLTNVMVAQSIVLVRSWVGTRGHRIALERTS